MSVVVILHFDVADLSAAKQSLADNAALLEEISGEAKALGARHHRFAANSGGLVVVDEWDNAEGFRRFFDGNDKVAKVTAEAGVQGPPTVEVLEPVEAAGTF
ncbi:hypothetical protein [Rhodococcus sp. UNC363MFTsu5.1]|uniref:hypothetical protein n=1 Tax=Rhodococcus sp. UNC363MFTsu5.1 TaxID=1449069 RepID=UPI000563D0C5|nr:hypothetical protein [Rhodococcus sp. UNC363MFTsu5.1]